MPCDHLGMPKISAACLSWAVAWRASPVSVFVTNKYKPIKATKHTRLATNCGWPIKTEPISNLPSNKGLSIFLKSGVQSNWMENTGSW